MYISLDRYERFCSDAHPDNFPYKIIYDTDAVKHFSVLPLVRTL